MSREQTWATPQYIFDHFNARFHYDLDLCAEPWSAKCPDFCSLPSRDAFREPLHGRRVWCNPPYDNIAKWVTLASLGDGRPPPGEDPWLFGSCTADIFTLLVPARTDQRWFHELFVDGTSCCHVEFIRGRIKFVPPPGWEGQINPKTGKIQKATSSAFPCMALHFGAEITPGFSCLEIPR